MNRSPEVHFLDDWVHPSISCQPNNGTVLMWPIFATSPPIPLNRVRKKLFPSCCMSTIPLVGGWEMDEET